jgi:hypothetical protein
VRPLQSIGGDENLCKPLLTGKVDVSFAALFPGFSMLATPSRQSSPPPANDPRDRRSTQTDRKCQQ